MKNIVFPKRRAARPGMSALIVRAMRLTLFLTLACVANSYATAYSQGAKLTLDLQDVKLSKVFNVIQRETDYQFLYNNEEVERAPAVSISVKDATVPQILALCFKNYPLSYRIVNKTVVVLRGLPMPPRLVAPLQSTVAPFQVRGKVTDAAGKPLVGVSVSVEGMQEGTTTDENGEFSLTLPDGNRTLLFSYIGYTKHEEQVKGRATVNVVMAPSVSSLRQLVVTALGIKQEKRSLSYITQDVNTESLTKARELNLVNSLEGKVAGLNISQTGSGVGAPSRVTLRGNRSINGDSQPLYVIDGVPVLGDPQYLDADNIASINVLKGANAAALYGSDAQNGAIIITTKKGQEGQIRVSLNNTFMFHQADLAIPFQNVYGQGINGTYQKGSGYSWGAKMQGQTVNSWTLDPSRSGETYAMTPQPDNVKDIFHTGFTLSNNLQASMGGKNTQAFFSATSTEATGILANNKLQRNNVMARVNSKLSGRFSLDVKLSYTRQKIDNPLRQSTNNFNPMQQIYDIPRNIRTQDAKKYEFPGPSGVMQQDFWAPGFSSTAENPYWVLNRNLYEEQIGRITGMASLTYQIADGLSLMVRSSYDRIDQTDQQKDYNGTLVRALYGRYYVTKGQNYEFNSDFLLSFEKSLSKDWSVDAHVGGNIKKQLLNESLSSNTGDALLVPNFFSLSNTNLPVTSYDPGAPINIQSLYAFGKLGWKDAVFLDLTGRNDWSSTLPASSRSYFYPSVGLSVVLSDLIPSFPKAFDLLKLRASYAKVGSSAPPFMLQRTAAFSAGGTNGFLSLSHTLPNKDLKPEETRSFESGFDVRLLKGRLGVNFTYFKTNTVNQLFTIALPVGSGASSFYTNGGNIQNKGEEVMLTLVPVQTKNITWTVGFNFSHLKNTVVSISDERPKVVIASNFASDYVIQQGLDFGDIFTIGFKRDSLGRVVVGSNGVPEIVNNKDVNVGSYTPDWTGGISSSFSFKNFNLSILIDHRQGGIVESFTRASLDYLGLTKGTLQGRDGGLIFGKNIFKNYTAVTEDGKPNNTPVDAQTLWSAVGNISLPVGEVYALDATNTRLRELIIGYTLPQSLVKALHLSNVNVSLVGRNLFFISRATPGLDPDILSGTGTSSEGFSSYPPPTDRSFGVNLKIDF
jgi:TonB-linked SusC/RagA family outer membrane protein